MNGDPYDIPWASKDRCAECKALTAKILAEFPGPEELGRLATEANEQCPRGPFYVHMLQKLGLPQGSGST